MPEVTTIDEAGVAGYDISVWYGIMAPAGTPERLGEIHRDGVLKFGKLIRAAGIKGE